MHWHEKCIVNEGSQICITCSLQGGTHLMFTFMVDWDPFKNIDGANILLFFNITGKV